MSELAPEIPAPQNVAGKALRGAAALGVRQILVQGTRILGGIFLARLLSPGQFGIYAIILYLQTFFTAFGDAGLAASLIRQHEEPNAADYRAVFTIQQILVAVVAFLCWLASPWLASRYHLRIQDAWLFRIAALSFLLTSFMVIPMARMERHLAFHKVAVVESAQSIAFNGFAVYFAWRGMGAYAFVWALLLRAAVGTVLANGLSPWRIRWLWDWERVRPHLSFSLPYQGIQVVSLLKDSITPILIGMLLGTAAVGYITWAAILAAYPVLVLSVLQRLYMPAFSRLQHHKEQLVAFTENVMWANNALAAPLAILTLVMVVPITTLVYGEKWLVALPYFFLFWSVNLVVPLTTPGMALLNALGKSKIVFHFALGWMVGIWIIGAPLIWLYGAIGFPIASIIVNLSIYWFCKAARRDVPFRYMRMAAPSWSVASVCGLIVYLLCRWHSPTHILDMGGYAAGGLIIYAAGMYLLYKNKIQSVWQSIQSKH